MNGAVTSGKQVFEIEFNIGEIKIQEKRKWGEKNFGCLLANSPIPSTYRDCYKWMSKSMEFFIHKFIIVSIKYVYNLERNRSQHRNSIRRGIGNHSEGEGWITLENNSLPAVTFEVTYASPIAINGIDTIHMFSLWSLQKLKSNFDVWFRNNLHQSRNLLPFIRELMESSYPRRS